MSLSKILKKGTSGTILAGTAYLSFAPIAGFIYAAYVISALSGIAIIYETKKYFKNK